MSSFDLVITHNLELHIGVKPAVLVLVTLMGWMKSARTVGAKGRVFPEALTQSALAGGGGVPFFAGKMHGTFIKHRNLQHFEAPDSLR